MLTAKMDDLVSLIAFMGIPAQMFRVDACANTTTVCYFVSRRRRPAVDGLTNKPVGISLTNSAIAAGFPERPQEAVCAGITDSCFDEGSSHAC